MAELPASVFPEDRADDPDPAKRSYSSAELRAHAMLLAWVYQNLEDVAADKSISTATATGLVNFEKEYFADAQDTSLTLAQRRQNLLAKYRSSGGISLQAITSIVDGILTPQGLSFAIIPWSGQNNGAFDGAWHLDQTPLGYGSYLSLRDPIYGEQKNQGDVGLDCSLNYQAANITQQDLLDIQQTAYTFEVAIYGNASAQTLSMLDAQLTMFEPARSTHFIRNNATPAADPNAADGGIYEARVAWR